MDKVTYYIFGILFGILVLNGCSKETHFFEKGDVDIHRFQLNVNTSFDGESMRLESDWGILLLPKTNHKQPVRLVIYCHSGGGRTTESNSEAENVDIIQYLIYKGYAVLEVCGMPESYANRIKVDYARTVGSHVSLRSVITSYDYVLKNFNIANDGCFVFSNSNGGLLASNIVNLTSIPVLAQSGLAPLLSIEKNAWAIASGAVFPIEGGFSKYQNRANIIKIFGMKNINNQQDLNQAIYEKNKVGKYDPFDYCIYQTTKPYRTPYLIFTLKEDNTVFYNLANLFMTEMNSRNSKISISDITEYGAHNVPSASIIVDNYTYMKRIQPLRLTVKAIGDFFDSYNPDINHSGK